MAMFLFEGPLEGPPELVAARMIGLGIGVVALIGAVVAGILLLLGH